LTSTAGTGIYQAQSRSYIDLSISASEIMSKFRLLRRNVFALRAALLPGIALLVSCAQTAHAQHPFQPGDLLYRDESARPSFYDGYAVSAELSYRPTGFTSVSGNVGLLFRADVEIARGLDLGAILNASSGLRSEGAILSWIALTRRWGRESGDSAIRLAFDPRPAADGTLGFRRTDLAFLHSATMSPLVSTDMAVGIRRVRSGFHRLQPAASGTADQSETSSNLFLTESRGLEAHLMFGYNMLFDPAQSHVSVSLVYEGGRYDLIHHPLDARGEVGDASSPSLYRGHMLWVRTGVRWNRPSYQIHPFVSVPLIARQDGTGPRQGKGPRFLSLGVRGTIR
jgi:hypothetical protein